MCTHSPEHIPFDSSINSDLSGHNRHFCHACDSNVYRESAEDTVPPPGYFSQSMQPFSQLSPDRLHYVPHLLDLCPM